MNDFYYMKRALELAKNGEGNTSPNPLVGAVIVKGGRIIGEGWHAFYGGPHAEVSALNTLTESANFATLYVTLEPCSHYGKTPPCVDAIIAHKFSRVVISMLDPNPIVMGRSAQKLLNHGIEVKTGVLEDQAALLNEPFIKFITTHRPLCVIKTAMTLDGKLASATGDSKWISNTTSRAFVHQLRNKYSAIMVGIGTILADDPCLTTRIEIPIIEHDAFNSSVVTKMRPGTDATRIIVDSHARIPLDSKILNLYDSTAKTIIATTHLASTEKKIALQNLGATVMIIPEKNGQVDLSILIDKLGELNIDSILIEGGSELNYSLLKEGLIDKIYSFIAPKLIGGRNAKTPIAGDGIQKMNDAIKLKNVKVSMMDDDILVEAFIDKEEVCLQD